MDYVTNQVYNFNISLFDTVTFTKKLAGFSY